MLKNGASFISLCIACGAAASVAHASDVKKAEDKYVQVCPAYGSGFYRIPGSDTCLRLGGFVRVDAYFNATGTFWPLILGQVADDALESNRNRARVIMKIDARSETEYGVLRAYIQMGMNKNSWNSGPSGNLSLTYDAAFIQFAGFTAGYNQSFFDSGLNYMYTIQFDKSDKLTNMWAYTAELGNGFSATVSLEDPQSRTTEPGSATYLVATGAAAGQTIYSSYSDGLAGSRIPDVVGNLRVEQGWGWAQLAGAVHRVSLTKVNLRGDYGDPGFGDFGSATEQWGFAIGGTLAINMPFLSPGDSMFVTASYADGAIDYAGLTGNNGLTPHVLGRVNAERTSGAIYNLADAVWNGYDDYDIASAWSIAGQARHFWTPALRSAVMVGYSSVDMPKSAWAMSAGYLDFNMWQVGCNTIWSPVKNLDIGAEIIYTKIEGDLPFNDGTYWNSADYKRGTGGTTGLVSGGLRVQRNF